MPARTAFIRTCCCGTNASEKIRMKKDFAISSVWRATDFDFSNPEFWFPGRDGRRCHGVLFTSGQWVNLEERVWPCKLLNQPRCVAVLIGRDVVSREMFCQSSDITRFLPLPIFYWKLTRFAGRLWLASVRTYSLNDYHNISKPWYQFDRRWSTWRKFASFWKPKSWVWGCCSEQFRKAPASADPAACPPMTITPIGTVRSCFSQRNGTPRQVRARAPCSD